MSGAPSGIDRGRFGWWVFVFVLAGAAAFIAYSFIGVLMLGVFGYYATRPIYRRLDRVIGPDGIAAALTIALIIVPVVLLVFYTGFQLFQHAHGFLGGPPDGSIWSYAGLGALPNVHQRTLGSIVRNPEQVLTNASGTLETVLRLGEETASAVFGTAVLIALGIALSYFSLEHETGLSNGLVRLFGGRDTVVYAYASAVDRDLQSVFFGNLVFVAVMAVLGTIAYWGTNLLAPAGLHVPLVLVLGVLTGISSLIPLVVSKVVFLPVVAYLGWQAVTEEGSLAFVGGVLVAYFVVLDFVPQTFIQPYITGRQLDVVMMMFGYVLGPILFGWYGFFLLPVVFVLMVEAIRIVLPELVQGETLTPEVSMAEGVGTDPPSTGEGHSEEETSEVD